MPESSDDLSITDDEVLYRRISNVAQNAFMVYDEATMRRRPTTAVFRPDEDGLSVFLDSILRSCELDENALLKNPLNGVLSITAGEVRSEGLGVAADPWPTETDDPEHPRNAAHALVVGLGKLSKSQRKEKQYALIGKCEVIIDPVV